MADNLQPPIELIEHLNRRDCVLFGGDALDVISQSAQLPSALVELARKMAMLPVEEQAIEFKRKIKKLRAEIDSANLPRPQEADPFYTQLRNEDCERLKALFEQLTAEARGVVEPWREIQAKHPAQAAGDS